MLSLLNTRKQDREDGVSVVLLVALCLQYPSQRLLSAHGAALHTVVWQVDRLGRAERLQEQVGRLSFEHPTPVFRTLTLGATKAITMGEKAVAVIMVGGPTTSASFLTHIPCLGS